MENDCAGLDRGGSNKMGVRIFLQGYITVSVNICIGGTGNGWIDNENFGLDKFVNSEEDSR